MAQPGWWLLLVLLAAAPVAGNAQTLASAGTKEWIEPVRPALAVMVSVNKRGQWKSFGTGFFMSEDGVLVTARHVAQAESGLFAITQDGHRHEVTGFLGQDRDYDVAVLKLEGHGFAYLRLATASLKTNDWVALVTPTDQWPALFHCTDAGPICSTGEVASLVSLPGLWLMIGTTPKARPGQSGSPLLNQAGEVVGIVPYVSREQRATASPITVAQGIFSKESGKRMIPFGKRPRTGGSTPLVMDSDFRAGCDSMRQQDWVEAERLMKLAAKHFSESPVPLAFLATISVKGTDYTKAHTYCRKSLQLQPAAFTFLLDGSSLVMLGRLHDGVATVKKSLELGLPDRAMQASAWALVASAETALGQRDQAQDALTQLERLDPATAEKMRHELSIQARDSSIATKRK